MKDVYDSLGTGVAYVVFVLGVLQFLVCPLVAMARGRSGAVWFFIALFWTFSGGWIGAIMSANFVATFSEDEGPLWASLVVGGMVLGITFLPTIFVLISRSKKPKYVPRRRRAPRFSRR